MVYSNKLIAVVKVNNNIIREEKDIVRIPFGSEYSILLKNISMTDAVVNISIDGNDVLANKSILVKSKEKHELTGFLDSNSQIKNRFKFIQKTDNIVKYRGDLIDDGIIDISFQFVKQLCPVVTCYPTWHHTYIPTYNTYGSTGTRDIYSNFVGGAKGNIGPSGPLGPSSGDPILMSSCCSSDIGASCIPNQDEGITVKGSTTFEQYQSIYVNNLDPEKFNIVLRLKGFDNKEQPLKTPIFTNTKIICSTCGRKSKSNMKFCPECGTSLI